MHVKNVSVEEWGLVVSSEHPFLATSTDGYVTEEGVNGKGMLEIKCPVTKKTVSDLSDSRKSFCLIHDADGRLKLKESHQYYTQIQFEMAISGCLWADFVVFTLPDDKEDEDLFVQRIPFSEEFWQKKLLFFNHTSI